MTVFEQLNKIKQERGTVHDELKTVAARTDDQGNLSADDQVKWEELTKRSTELKAQMDRTAKLAEIEAENAQRTANGLPGDANEQSQKREGKETDKEQYRSAFERFLRANAERPLSPEDRAILKRGTSTQVSTTAGLGGNVVPEGFYAQVEKYLKLYGGMLSACRIMPTNSGNPFKWPTVDETTITGGYVDQGVAPAVSDVTLAKVDFPVTPTMTSGIVKVAWELQNDSGVDIESLVAELVAERIGRFANAQFTAGATSGKVAGFVPNVTVGKTSASNSAFTRLELLDLMFSVNASYRKNAAWMFNDSILAALAKLALGSGDARPLWVPSMREGVPDTLEGKPYFINEDMDSLGADNKPIAFGDFSKYIIRQVGGMGLQMTNERYWDESVTGYKAEQRYDGRLINNAAIKIMANPS